MDLVTLVTACSLAVEPKIMHALIWRQSGGEPWSFTVPDERQPQVYQTISEAIRAMRATDHDVSAVRIGLTGLRRQPSIRDRLMFATCPNIAVAARQIVQLGERCKTLPRFKADPVYCAIAAYHGSWERPDTGFANAVRTSVVKGDAPDFDMPKDANFDFADVEVAVLPPLSDATAAPTIAPDDRQHAWSSALFPTKPQQLDRSSTNPSVSGSRAEELQAFDARGARPPIAIVQTDGLFVPRSPQRRPQ